MTVDNQSAGRCVVEIQAYVFGDRHALSARLQGALGASGCAALMYTKMGRWRIQYIFEADLDRIVDLYCGLVEAGLELTEGSHRSLTELCVRRNHERLSFVVVLRPQTLRIRLVVGFEEGHREIAEAPSVGCW